MRPQVLLLCLLLGPVARARARAADAPVPAMEAIDFAEAVRRATQQATSAALAGQEVARVEALLWEVRSAALPLVSANASVTRNDAARSATTLVETTPRDPASIRSLTVRTVPQTSRNANLSASVPLFAPSRWYQWSHAADQVQLARANARDVERLVALTAARAYLTIIAQKRSIDVSRRAVQTAAAHFEYARVRRQGGVGNTLDEARADQQLATAQAQLESALNGLVRAQEALGVAVGGDVPLDAAGEPDLSGGPATADEGLRLAEDGRTDVVLARERVRAARRVAKDSWADWLPTLSLGAQTYWQSPATSSLPDRGWQAQLLLNFPLFEGGLRVGQTREREALAAEARLVLEGTLQQARSDVRTAYAGLGHAEVALEQNRRGADRAQAALSLVEQAFKAGATTSLDVTDAERTARDADSAAVIAEDAVRQSRLDLLAATGRFP